MLHKDVGQLREELRVLFRERCTKSELLIALKARLNRFQHLKGTAFQESINDFIIDRAEDGCEIVMYDEDITEIWQG